MTECCVTITFMGLHTASSSPSPSVHLGAIVPASVKTALERRAAEEDRSLSAVVRAALREYVREEQRAEREQL